MKAPKSGVSGSSGNQHSRPFDLTQTVRECEDPGDGRAEQGQVMAKQASSAEERKPPQKGRGAQGTRGNCLHPLMAFIGGWGTPPPSQNRQGSIVPV